MKPEDFPNYLQSMGFKLIDQRISNEQTKFDRPIFVFQKCNNENAENNNNSCSDMNVSFENVNNGNNTSEEINRSSDSNMSLNDSMEM